MLEQVSSLLHPGCGLEKGRLQAASEPWDFPNDDSARPMHRLSGYGPATPRCTDVLPPGTPEEAPAWARLLPAIRVVGRGMEDRVHGGSAALAALQACAAGAPIPLVLASAGVGAGSRNTSPFQAYSCSPDAARPQPVPTGGGKAGGSSGCRSLVVQDSASSLGPGGTCLNLDTPSTSPSFPTPFNSGFALDSPSTLTDMSEGPSPPNSPLGARATAPRPDLSRRVHGSCSYGDMCQAVMAAAAALGPDLSEEAALYRKLGAAQQRLSRLDSGGLLAALGGL